MVGKPWDKPWENPLVEGGGGGGVPRGQLELPWPRLRWRWQSSPEPASPAPAPTTPPEVVPRSWNLPDPKSKLPFVGETEPQLAPRKEGAPTSGIFKGGGLTVELQSGYDRPTLNVPDESSDFDIITLSHVEGHAAALMRKFGISEARLQINNPKICGSCMRDLESKMLPPGATLHVILPDGY